MFLNFNMFDLVFDDKTIPSYHLHRIDQNMSKPQDLICFYHLSPLMITMNLCSQDFTKKLMSEYYQ